MKNIVTPLVLALILLVAGLVCWTLGEAQEQIAQVKTQVTTMEYGAVADNGAELDRSLGYASRVPALGSEMTNDAKDARATAAYWLARYDTLELARDAGGGLVERDPRILLLDANAGYRSIPSESVDRQTYLQVLDALIRNYGDVLKANPEDDDPVNAIALEDAAYNYEFVIRKRETIGKLRPGATPPPVANADLLPPSIHGRTGGPPKDSDTSKFKIVVPKRSDERGDNPEGGQGQQKIRKG
jgi:hypothetical protein